MTEASTESSDDAAIEQHRAIVRQLDKSFASVYGFGGMAVIAFAAIPVVAAWFRGWLTSFGTWIVAITFGLIGLYLLRSVVRRRRRALRKRFESYCEVNDIDPEAVAAHFEEADTFPYFVSLFERDRATGAPKEIVDER